MVLTFPVPDYSIWSHRVAAIGSSPAPMLIAHCVLVGTAHDCTANSVAASGSRKPTAFPRPTSAFGQFLRHSRETPERSRQLDSSAQGILSAAAVAAGGQAQCRCAAAVSRSSLTVAGAARSGLKRKGTDETEDYDPKQAVAKGTRDPKKQSSPYIGVTKVGWRFGVFTGRSSFLYHLMHPDGVRANCELWSGDHADRTCSKLTYAATRCIQFGRIRRFVVVSTSNNPLRRRINHKCRTACHTAQAPGSGEATERTCNVCGHGWLLVVPAAGRAPSHRGGAAHTHAMHTDTKITANQLET